MKELTGFEDIFEAFFSQRRKELDILQITGVDIYLPNQKPEIFIIGVEGVTGIGRGNNGDVVVNLGDESKVYTNIPHVFTCKKEVELK